MKLSFVFRLFAVRWDENTAVLKAPSSYRAEGYSQVIHSVFTEQLFIHIQSF